MHQSSSKRTPRTTALERLSYNQANGHDSNTLDESCLQPVAYSSKGLTSTEQRYSLTHARYAGWNVGQQQRNSTPVCFGPASERSPRCDGGS